MQVQPEADNHSTMPPMYITLEGFLINIAQYCLRIIIALTRIMFQATVTQANQISDLEQQQEDDLPLSPATLRLQLAERHHYEDQLQQHHAIVNSRNGRRPWASDESMCLYHTDLYDLHQRAREENEHLWRLDYEQRNLDWMLENGYQYESELEQPDKEQQEDEQHAADDQAMPRTRNI
ncbi:hypothetical protein MN608_11057 [Microdochium nivale]|nr:hypothetical protein MN608_11057 [Microdochium nivale]